MLGVLGKNVFLVSLALYLIGALVSLAFNRFPRLSNYLAQGCAILAGLMGVVAGVIFLANRGTVSIHFPPLLPFTQLALSIDSLSAFFILVISLVTIAVSIYTLGYAREFYGSRKAGLLGFLYNIFVLSMMLVVSAGNGILFLITWEVMTMVSYFLVTFEYRQESARKAGFIYLVMTHLGTLFITLAFLTFYYYFGSFDFNAYRGGGVGLLATTKNLIFLMALVGFGTKAGIIPMHIWLPRAHPAAPSNVSALMSGVMIKTAIYAMVRLIFDLLGGGPLWWGLLVLVLGAVSALLGVMYALMEHNLKRLLAFHSVENIGIILLGLAGAMIFASGGQGPLAAFALAAALYHVLNHAVFKGLLFLGAGAVVSATHSTDMEQMGGLIKRMPWTALFFLVGSVSISALPPFNGFISEWLTFQVLFQLGSQLPSGLIRFIAPLSGAALALTGALAAACFVKAFGVTFLAQPRSKKASQAIEVPLTMRWGMAMLVLLCLILGILPGPVLQGLEPVVAGMVGTGLPLEGDPPGWLVLAPQAGSIGDISLPAVAGMLLLLTLAGWLLPRIIGRKTGLRIDETWNCGEQLTPMMEYTATSFAKPIKIIFKTILQPWREVAATFEGAPYFGKAIKYRSRIKPVFEDYFYHPVTGLVLQLAHGIRRIQAGSVHLYLTYILVTLVVLLLTAR